VIEEYVNWLIEIYTARTGVPVEEPDVIPRAIRVLDRHRWRSGGQEDFVSLVAADLADRLHELGEQPTVPPFLKMLDQSADAVRHRIARAARRWVAHPPGEVLEQVAQPGSRHETVIKAIADELLARLSVEEQAVLSLYLEGTPIDQLALELGVSTRTVYRKLRDIERQLARNDPAPEGP